MFETSKSHFLDNFGKKVRMKKFEAEIQNFGTGVFRRGYAISNKNKAP